MRSLGCLFEVSCLARQTSPVICGSSSALPPSFPLPSHPLRPSSSPRISSTVCGLPRLQPFCWQPCSPSTASRLVTRHHRLTAGPPRRRRMTPSADSSGASAGRQCRLTRRGLEPPRRPARPRRSRRAAAKRRRLRRAVTRAVAQIRPIGSPAGGRPLRSGRGHGRHCSPLGSGGTRGGTDAPGRVSSHTDWPAQHRGSKRRGYSER